jgi:hypothetical protein
VRMSPDARLLVDEMIEVLVQRPHLSSPDLAAALEPRLDQLVAGLAPSLAPIRRKLFAIRGWFPILRRPGALQPHGGMAYVRSFLFADCFLLDCLLAGPPDPGPEDAPPGGGCEGAAAVRL